MTTLLIRAIAPDDLPAFLELAKAAGPGMTTLPPDEEKLAEKIARSVSSFGGGAGDLFVLVLEDVERRQVVGTAALMTNIGSEAGFFAFRRTPLFIRSPEIDVSVKVEVLHLTNEHTGLSEVGTLFLLPAYRRDGIGRMLARARYLLIACARERFATRIVAELRGWQEADGTSPFWEAVGRPFFKMSFAEADRVSAVKGNTFIADLMPRHPIYVDLLPASARDVIGRPHSASAPALALLRKEGFRYEGCVDVFDAGPNVHADVEDIETFKRSRVGRVVLGDGRTESLVAVPDLARFRVARGPVTAVGHAAIMPRALADLLRVAANEEVRHVPV